MKYKPTPTFFKHAQPNTWSIICTEDNSVLEGGFATLESAQEFADCEVGCDYKIMKCPSLTGAAVEYRVTVQKNVVLQSSIVIKADSQEQAETIAHALSNDGVGDFVQVDETSQVVDVRLNDQGK